MFNINDIGKELSDKSDRSFAQCSRFINNHLRKITNIKDLIGNFPSEDEIYFLFTLNSFNAFTFIPYIINYSGLITNLVFSTYSINKRIVNSLMRWYDKHEIKNIHIVISDSIRNRMPKIVDLIKSCMTTRHNIKLDFSWNHSKITLIESGSNKFVIEGSGNFSENAQHEQYIFLNNKNIYDFRYRCISGTVTS